MKKVICHIKTPMVFDERSHLGWAIEWTNDGGQRLLFFAQPCMTQHEIVGRRRRDIRELRDRERSLSELWAMYNRLRQYKRVRLVRPDLGIVRKEIRRQVAQVRELRRRVGE